jgi:hypothetical protein
MRQLRYSIIFICLILIGACSNGTRYINNYKTCKLQLYSDSTYKFIYPYFFGKRTETGYFKLIKDTLTLTREEINTIDSVDISYTCYMDNPDSLLITFLDLYDNALSLQLFINDSKKCFNVGDCGRIIISYKDLEKQGILSNNDKIKSFRFVYDNKIYNPDMSPYKDSRKPDRLDFKLNQFIGKKYAILKRVYRFDGDTIYLNDIERKSIGNDNKLHRIK